MKTVAHILDGKGQEVWAVAPTDTVYSALELMAEKGVGAVLVMDGARLAGIISERDYARKVILMDRSSKVTPVADIMTTRVSVVSPDRSVEECMALMTDMHIRHLPVVSGEEVVGVVSIGDIVKAAISEREFMIEQLERYITGG
jgi:CBS domain-containing protein